MKLKTKSYNVKKLLEYKSNSYKRKYFILSSLFKSNITESNRLYEEFICYTDALNYSNGMYPNENDLISFYKECMKYSNYSDQIVETKVLDVIWTPSKDGYLKPRVKIEPVTLGGAKI